MGAFTVGRRVRVRPALRGVRYFGFGPGGRSGDIGTITGHWAAPVGQGSESYQVQFSDGQKRYIHYSLLEPLSIC